RGAGGLLVLVLIILLKIVVVLVVVVLIVLIVLVTVAVATVAGRSAHGLSRRAVKRVGHVDAALEGGEVVLRDALVPASTQLRVLAARHGNHVLRIHLHLEDVIPVVGKALDVLQATDVIAAGA